jgi:hypothetical protein
MIIVLHVESNGKRAQRIQLRANQVAKIGRSEWADFSFGEDAAMSDVQFEVRSTEDACLVRSLSAESPTFVNGQEIDTAAVYDGDEIVAGRTKFLVHIEGDRTATLAPADAAPVPELAEMPRRVELRPADVSLVAVCAYLEFSDEIAKPAAAAKAPDELIALLADEGKHMDALRLRAYLLTKREAVWWGCLCVHDDLDESLPAPQMAALKAAATWVGQPDEANRRAAEKRAAAAQYSGVGATLALAAFWSEGSIAPEGGTVVVPDERLTSQGVAAALIAAAYQGDATKAKERISTFLARGKDIADNKIRPPEGSPGW